MVSVMIFVEGGGDSKELRTRCREGFSKLIKNMGFAGHMPRIVACGGRGNTYEMFKTAFASVGIDEYPILLVDRSPENLIYFRRFKEALNRHLLAGIA